MGKIIASYLVKVHLHESEDSNATSEQLETLTNDDVKTAIITGVGKELSADVTVSLIERTDAD